MGLGNLKIGFRLYGGFGIVVLLAVAVGVIAVLGMYELAGLTSKMYRHPLAVSNAVRDVKVGINAMHRSMKDVALSEKIEDVNRFAAIVEDYEQNVYESFNIIFDRFLGDKRDVSKAHQSFSDWKVIRDEVILLSRAGEKDKAIAITKGKGARHVAYMDDNIQFMIDFASSKADSFINNAQITKSNVIRNTIILVSVMFVAGGIIALFITRSITVPVHKIVGRVKDIASGCHEQKLDINRSDEIGKLSESINQMSSQINKQTFELNRNQEQQRKINIEIEIQNRLKTGLHKLSASMHGEQEIAKLGDNILRSIVTFFNLPLGAVYVLNSDNMLQRVSSYGYPQGRDIPESFAIGSGLVGQAASQREPITIDNIPEYAQNYVWFWRGVAAQYTRFPLYQ